MYCRREEVCPPVVSDAVQRLDYAACGDISVEMAMFELGVFVEAQSFATQVPSEW